VPDQHRAAHRGLAHERSAAAREGRGPHLLLEQGDRGRGDQEKLGSRQQDSRDDDPRARARHLLVLQLLAQLARGCSGQLQSGSWLEETTTKNTESTRKNEERSPSVGSFGALSVLCGCSVSQKKAGLISQPGLDSNIDPVAL